MKEKVVFALKVYDLVKTNVALLANSSNHKVLFPKYSRNIPPVSAAKKFQGYPGDIIILWKCFYEVKNFEKLFCGLSCENFDFGSLLSWNVFWTLLKRLLLMHHIIITAIIFFRQLFHGLVCSAQLKIFGIACPFDITQFDNTLQKYFNCSYHGSTSLPTRIIEPSSHQTFTCQ